MEWWPPGWDPFGGPLRFDLLGRLLLAAFLGGAIGLEREVSGKPAGFRTNLLICLGAALLTELSVAIALAADPTVGVADPARIAAQIVSGIGFLGAGTIIQSRGSVVGLTTAATMWVVAAIGMAVGAGAYLEAVGTTLLVIVALIFLGRIEAHMLRRRSEQHLQVTLAPDAELIYRIRDMLVETGLEVHLVEVERERSAFVASLSIMGSAPAREQGLRRLLGMDAVQKVSHL